jgi:hypothetical protein
MSTSKQQGFRERNPDKPVLGILGDRYSEWYLEFCPTGEATRSEFAEVFFENASEAAERYVEMEECSRPDWWNEYTRDPESKMWMNKHYDERTTWAKSIDLLWQFSDGEDVDADALREALIRMSFRRHRQGSRRDRNEEHIFVKAAKIVREKADLERMTEQRETSIHEDYQ